MYSELQKYKYPGTILLCFLKLHWAVKGAWQNQGNEKEDQAASICNAKSHTRNAAAAASYASYSEYFPRDARLKTISSIDVKSNGLHENVLKLGLLVIG
jgi:hypothetical protein